MSVRMQFAKVFPGLSGVWERRKSPRRDFVGLKCDQGWIVNLSMTGAKLLSREPLEEPIRMRLGEGEQTAAMSGEIVWFRQIGPDLHVTAVNFRGVKREARKILASTIEEYTEQVGGEAHAQSEKADERESA